MLIWFLNIAFVNNPFDCPLGNQEHSTLGCLRDKVFSQTY